jgi:signal transduction histidine kinase
LRWIYQQYLETQEIISIIITGTIVFGFFCFAIILFVLYYMKSKKLHIQQLNNEVLKAEINSIERTSTRISRELHDNIAQHLSAACILLQEEVITSKDIKNIYHLVDDSVRELRDISRSLTAHHLEQIDLLSGIESEISIYKTLKNCKIEFSTEKDLPTLNKESQLMLLRICQEALSNAIRHSQSKLIKIMLGKNSMIIRDEGQGFDMGKASESMNGIFNMKQRARFMGAELEYRSSPGKGTEVIISFTA